MGNQKKSGCDRPSREDLAGIYQEVCDGTSRSGVGGVSTPAIPADAPKLPRREDLFGITVTVYDEAVAAP